MALTTGSSTSILEKCAFAPTSMCVCVLCTCPCERAACVHRSVCTYAQGFTCMVNVHVCVVSVYACVLSMRHLHTSSLRAC